MVIDEKRKGAHIFVCECLFEFVVGHEAYTRLNGVSDDESRAASIQPADSLRAQRLSDDRQRWFTLYAE